MRVEYISISDFYSNPDDMRKFLLTQTFNRADHYPGLRTKSYLDDSVKNTIQTYIRPFAGEVTWWGNEDSGAFQYATSQDRSWMHVDATSWAGICYLTPDAPLSSGTGLFRHKATKVMNYKWGTKEENDAAPHAKQYQDMTKWELVDRIGNVYNRLILYRGNLFHTSLDYFGNTLEDGRLFQTFFFNTEK